MSMVQGKDETDSMSTVKGQTDSMSTLPQDPFWAIFQAKGPVFMEVPESVKTLCACN